MLLKCLKYLLCVQWILNYAYLVLFFTDGIKIRHRKYSNMGECVCVRLLEREREREREREKLCMRVNIHWDQFILFFCIFASYCNQGKSIENDLKTLANKRPYECPLIQSIRADFNCHKDHKGDPH